MVPGRAAPSPSLPTPRHAPPGTLVAEPGRCSAALYIVYRRHRVYF